MVDYFNIIASDDSNTTKTAKFQELENFTEFDNSIEHEPTSAPAFLGNALVKSVEQTYDIVTSWPSLLMSGGGGGLGTGDSPDDDEFGLKGVGAPPGAGGPLGLGASLERVVWEAVQATQNTWNRGWASEHEDKPPSGR